MEIIKENYGRTQRTTKKGETKKDNIPSLEEGITRFVHSNIGSISTKGGIYGVQTLVH